jgi:hypothetical protein
VKEEFEKRNLQKISFEGFYTTQSFQTKILIKRSILNIKRNPLIVKARVLMNILISLLLGAIYYKLDNGENNPINLISIQDKNGFLFFFATV